MSRKISKKKEEAILELLRKGKIHTDSDIYELAKRLHTSYSAVSVVIANEQYKDTPCYKCAHIENRMYFSPGEPCNRCSRLIKTNDYYEKA